MKDLFLQIDAFGGDTQFVDAMPVRVHAVAASEISNKEVNFNWTGLPGALEPTPDGHHWQNAVVVLNAGSHLDYFGSQSCGGSLPTDPCVPNTSSDVYIYADSIDARALQDGVSAVQALAARRATVAHEVGHAVNLYHNDGLQCVMYGYGFTAQGAWSNIPEMFCTGVNVTIFGCYACDPNTASMTVSNFDEVDTLVIKPPL